MITRKIIEYRITMRFLEIHKPNIEKQFLQYQK